MESSNNRITTAYRARDLKRHQLRFAASFSRSSNPSMYGIRRPIGGAIRYRQSRRLRNDESRFESLNCGPCWATRRHADQKSRVWWRSGPRMNADVAAITMRVQYGNALCEISRNIRLCRRWQERWLYSRARGPRGESSPIIHRLGWQYRAILHRQ